MTRFSDKLERGLGLIAVLALVAAAIGSLGYPEILQLSLYVGGPSFFIAFLLAWRARRQSRRLARLRIQDLDSLPGLDFEAWIRTQLEKEGLVVESMGGTKDYGIDLIAQWKGLRIGIQAKRLSKNVGNAAVIQAIAGAGHHDCHCAAVVTQSKFTGPAREQAEHANLPVALFDRSALPDLAKRLKSMQEPA